MYSYSESGLEFQFQEDCEICKFDEHRFFRWLSGSGMKGVDFLILFREELILLEIKNFDQWVEQEEELVAEVLYQELSGKREGTYKVIEVVNAYLSRKWRYRWWRKWLFPNYPLPIIFREWHFWTRAQVAIRRKEARFFFLAAGLPQSFAEDWQGLEREGSPENNIYFIPFSEKDATPPLPPFLRMVV